MNALSAVAARPGLRRVRRTVLLLGPAMVASAAYVDPGNVATNVVAGSRHGYLLLWVVVGATLAAGLVQYQSAKLGLVTGRSLPEVLGDRLPRAARLAYWVQAELVCAATDLAEILGGAVALHLLTGLPLLAGGVVTAVASAVLLVVADRGGQRRFERAVAVLLAVVVVGFVAGLFRRPPDPAAALAGLVPGFAGPGSVLLAAGMLGATVMPHAIYVHSSLSRDRHGRVRGPRLLARLLAATRADVTIALLVAGVGNLGLVLLGAVLPADGPRPETLEGVHAALGSSIGPTVATLFAVALLCSGLASTSVGCCAGSVVMAGLLRVRVTLLVRRTVTVVPALAALAWGVEPTWLLVASQVVLSFGIPLALVPLVVLTSRPAVMGEHTTGRTVAVLAWTVTAAVVAVNVTLIVLGAG